MDTSIVFGIGGLILTFVLGLAALYQGSLPKQPQHHASSTKPIVNSTRPFGNRPHLTQQLQETSELPQKPPFWEAVAQIIGIMALATVSLFFAIQYLFIPFVIWLSTYEYGWLYILAFSAFLITVVTICYFVWKGRKNQQCE